MKFTRPAWVTHSDDSGGSNPYALSSNSATNGSNQPQKKALSIFSISVHPDDSRIATGGLDTNVRIWSTAPILNEEVELAMDEGKIPEGSSAKLLATLGMHAGPVLCVRWSKSGRWLASGSDDSVVLVWDLDPAPPKSRKGGGGFGFGGAEKNLENWKPMKRLTGHDSDVVGLDWSPGDRYLASVGLDSSVIVWDGRTLERIQQLYHDNFVKGVCWDPAGEFLASCSDDKSVKVWRRHTNPVGQTHFTLESTITKPFDRSPSSFFRHLSWSPDGAHITVANATNGKGMVFVAAVISRKSWDSEISLVGHAGAVQAVCFNPHIFVRDKAQPANTSNICSVVALGGDDCSVSVWATKSARPLIVARDAFSRPVLDLDWSSDGLSLYACSSDGTIAVFTFTEDELDGMTPPDIQESYMERFTTYREIMGGVKREEELAARLQQQAALAAAANQPGGGEEVVTTLVARKGKSKNRPALTSVGGLGSGPGNFGRKSMAALDAIPSSGAPPGGAPHMGMGGMGVLGMGGSPLSSLPPSGPVSTIGFGLPSAGMTPGHGMFDPHGHPHAHAHRHSHHSHPSQFGHGMGMGMENRHAAFADRMMGGGPVSPGFNAPPEYGFGGAGEGDVPMVDVLPGLDTSPPRPGAIVPVRPRTLGGDRDRERERNRGEGRRIDYPVNGVGLGGGPVVGGGDGGGPVLPLPELKNWLSTTASPVLGGTGGGGDDVVEAVNDPRGEPTEISYVTKQGTQWLDYLPSPVLLLTLSFFSTTSASSGFVATASLNGVVNVYSLTGRRIMPALMLGDPCAFLESRGAFLLAITATGAMRLWNVKSGTAHIPPASIAPLLRSQGPNSTIVFVSVRANGAPIIQFSSGTIYAYDKPLSSWVVVSDGWWSGGSDVWNNRANTRGSNSNSGQGIVAQLEATVPAMDPRADAERPKWWSEALTLGHLESRMHAARVLDASGQEFKQALLQYSKRLADEGFRGKAEELVKELCGPIYWKPGSSSGQGQGFGRDETICGIGRRELLRDVLTQFARSKTLTKMAQDWQELLKKAASED